MSGSSCSGSNLRLSHVERRCDTIPERDGDACRGKYVSGCVWSTATLLSIPDLAAHVRAATTSFTAAELLIRFLTSPLSAYHFTGLTSAATAICEEALRSEGTSNETLQHCASDNV